MDFCKNYPLPDWKAGFEHRSTSVSQLPYEEYTGILEKSASDTNDYRLIRLPNNLVVMCMQDSETETAAAALSVNVGSSMDPVELQGLAHFLEHMLFMGTEKYPDENEFSSFISEHSGDSNAYTQFSKTTFYLGVANDALEGALDRFSSFFTSPLFKRDCVDRELCAVDSEFKGLLTSDFWRSHQIECRLCSSDHPYSKFMPGNIDSLQQSAKDHGLDLHEELLKFYNKHYSSDIMKLVVCGNHALDQLVEWTVSKFSGIKSKGDNVQRIVDHPVTAEFLGKVVYYETVDETHDMRITFPVPDVKAMYRSDPFNYISHLINHEGQGSIMSHLKQKGWATSLGAYTNVGQDKGFGEFSVSIGTTPEGLEHYEDILKVVFAYVRMLVSSGPQEWVHSELSFQAKNGFDYKKKSGAVSQALSYMYLIFNEYVAPEHSLSKDSAYEEFDFDAILRCLSFVNPDNFRVFIGATKHKSIDCSEVEPYFGAAYHVASLSADLLSELASNNTHVDGLALPEKNDFMPTDFTIKNTNILGAAPVLRPTLLRLDDSLELWFKQDDQFSTTKGNIYLSINVPAVSSSPQNYIMSKLYCSMLGSDLDSELYNAACAGLRFGVYPTNNSIEIFVTGFSSKLAELLKTVVERTKSFKVDSTQLSVYMTELKQAYGNVVNSSPSCLCGFYTDYINKSSLWHYKLIESELPKVTLEKLQAHVDSLFDTSFIKMGMVGNFDEEEALKVAVSVQNIIKPSPNLGYLATKSRPFNFEPGYYLHQLQMPNNDCVNSAVECSIYCGQTAEKREVVLLEVLQELVHDSFFALASYQASARIQVEGESNPMFMTMHINKFIHDMQQHIADLTDEQFDNRVKSLIKLYQERMKNIDEEAGIYEGHVCANSYMFNTCDIKVGFLQSIAKTELLELWNRYVNPSTAAAYTRIDVQMWSTRIWKPTESDFKRYSAKTLALYGCMHSEGNVDLDIGKVDEFIATAIATRPEQVENNDDSESLMTELKSASLSVSGATYSPGKGAEMAAHTSAALALAAKDHETFGNYGSVSHTNFATIGMDKTPDGLWLMTDYKKFQATQKLYGLGVPAEVLVPKYSS
ncbi:metalloprotease [Coemansia spiralis]|uniref:Metalloprotease n=1 Tax=Coemansia spiralis TaxID=417178 RepID=A0A9W8GIY6_9FUNG|nr:metalloprotease [Coemansia spiralis]